MQNDKDDTLEATDKDDTLEAIDKDDTLEAIDKDAAVMQSRGSGGSQPPKKGRGG